MLDSLLPISDIILLEALVLGVLSTQGLILVLLIPIGKLQWIGEGFRALCKMSPQSLIVGGLLALFPVYFLGVIANQAADMWIDKPSYYHLWLKPRWNDYSAARTDDSIKCVMYSRVFGCGKGFYENCRKGEERYVDKANEWYHEVSNHTVLMKDDKFRRYILYSQKQVNVARLWTFVSLFVFAACLVRLVFLLGRAGWYRQRLELSAGLRKSDLLSVVIVASIAFILYVVGGNVWARAEEQTSSKVWRFARSFPEKVPKKIPWLTISRLGKCPPASESVE